MRKNYAMVLCAALLLMSCGSKETKTADQQNEKAKVKIAEVTAQDVPQTQVYTATVESDVKNNISPNASYRIQRILVDVGDNVAKGQVVVVLDNAGQEQMNSQVQSQMAQIESQMAQLQNQQTEFKRIEDLYNIGGTSKSDYDAARTQLTIQQKQLEALKKQKEMLATQLRQVSQNTRLTSPISGVVTARNYDDGDMYGGSPILTVEQLSPVKLKISVSEEYYTKVSVGQPVEIELDAYGDEVFGGTVSIIYPTIDNATHTFPIEVTVPNSDKKVRPGMFARASIDFGTENRVMVPDMALVKQVGAGDRYVYVYKDGKVKYSKVQLGRHIGDQYEIISGVDSGSKVVVAGMTGLADGKEVEVIK